MLLPPTVFAKSCICQVYPLKENNENEGEKGGKNDIKATCEKLKVSQGWYNKWKINNNGRVRGLQESEMR